MFARYSFQDNVPFLAGRFGTVGLRASIDLFDGGRKRAVVRERETQLAQAKENLARMSDEVELRVQTAFNKMERTRQMVAVSEELLALRGESRRVAAELLANGGALGSQAKESTAQELDAQAALLQSQLDYVQAARRDGCGHRATTSVATNEPFPAIGNWRFSDEWQEHVDSWDRDVLARRCRRSGDVCAGQVHREGAGRARIL